MTLLLMIGFSSTLIKNLFSKFLEINSALLRRVELTLSRHTYLETSGDFPPTLLPTQKFKSRFSILKF